MSAVNKKWKPTHSPHLVEIKASTFFWGGGGELLIDHCQRKVTPFTVVVHVHVHVLVGHV